MDGVHWSAIRYLILAGQRFYTEQNGRLKIIWYREHRLLIQYRSDRGLPLTITNEDVMPLLNRDVAKSFAIVETNKKQLATVAGIRQIGYCCRIPKSSRLPPMTQAWKDTPIRQQQPTQPTFPHYQTCTWMTYLATMH